MVHKVILCFTGYIYATLSYAANLTLHGQCRWHQLVNVTCPYELHGEHSL
jgi:hypothetical protein